VNLQIKSGHGLIRRTTIDLNEDDFKRNLIEQLQKLTNEMKPDRVSDSDNAIQLLEQLADKSAHNTLLTQVMSNCFEQAISEYIDSKIVGEAVFEILQMTPGNGLKFSASFDVYPVINLPDLKTYEFSQLVASIQQQDIDRTLLSLQRQLQEWKIVDRASLPGDSVIINYQAQNMGKAFAGKAMRVELTDTANDSFQGFEKGLTGVAAGQKTTIDITFPEDNYPESVAGKTIVFDVEVLQVEAEILPEIDSEFAKSHSIADGSIESLRRTIGQNMDTHLQKVIRMKNTLNLFSEILTNHPVDSIPETLVNQEIQRQVCDPCEEVEGVESYQRAMDPADFTELAQNRVKRSLLIYELAREFKITPDSNEIRLRLEDLVEEYPEKERIIDWFYQDKLRLAGIESDVLGEQVADWIFENFKTRQVETTYAALMDF